MRALMAVREREAAEMAFLIALEPPTAGMVKDAASAGFYQSATGKKYPRLQLLTIEGLMNGSQLLARSHLPPLVPCAAASAEHPDAAPVNFKQAKKEATTGQQGELL